MVLDKASKAPLLENEDGTEDVSSKSTDEEMPTHSKWIASQGKKGQKSQVMPALVKHRRKAVQYDSSSDEEEQDAFGLEPDSEDEDEMVEKETKKRTWKCVFCPDVFSERATMVSHCKVHEGKRNYTCPCCEKKFRRAEPCNLHFNEHFIMKCYSCRSCGRRFAHLGNLWNHKLMHQELHKRAQRKQPNWICGKCSQTFVIKSDLVEHCSKAGPCYDAKLAKPLEGSLKQKFPEMLFFLGSVPDPPNGNFEMEVVDNDGEALVANGHLDANPILRAALGVPEEPKLEDGAYSLASLK